MTTDTPHPHAGWTSSTAAPDPGDAEEDRQAADLRQEAIARLRFMSTQHATHAWERRYRDPIAPYGLAFLFAQRTRSRWYSLKAATKLWLAGPETGDLERLLHDFRDVVARYSTDPGFDVRTDLANRSDEGMAEDACYIGVGLTSLDTRTGTWEQARSRVTRDIDLPAQIRIVMVDGTVILIDRRGVNEFGTLTVTSTHRLSASWMDTLTPWSTLNAADLADPFHARIVRCLQDINSHLWQADNARLVARRLQP